jgi:hypothetical protein
MKPKMGKQFLVLIKNEGEWTSGEFLIDSALGKSSSPRDFFISASPLDLSSFKVIKSASSVAEN